MTKTIFRVVVAASIILLFGSGVAPLLVDQQLPAELDRWLQAQSDLTWGAFEWVAIVLGLGSIAASFGLLFFARWARLVYAAGIPLIVAATLFTGPSVTSALEAFFGEVSLFLDGFILALAYFSDARHYFAPPPSSSSTA